MWAGEDIVAEYREKELKATAAALDSSGRFLVLAGRLGASLIDLQSPGKIVRRLHRKSKWEVNVAAWNQHSEYRNLIAIASNQKVDIINFDYLTQDLLDPQNSMKGHARTVLDLDWDLMEPTLLATCSVDNYVYVW